nr:hypothetical protein Iba_chr06bCG13000 [Ipomoea batatas]
MAVLGSEKLLNGSGIKEGTRRRREYINSPGAIPEALVEQILMGGGDELFDSIFAIVRAVAFPNLHPGFHSRLFLSSICSTALNSHIVNA